MSQNYWNMSVWIRRFYSKLWKRCKPSSLNSSSPCSSLPASLLSLCSQSTFLFQVLSCSSEYVRMSSLLLQLEFEAMCLSTTDLAETFEIFSFIGSDSCLITHTPSATFQGNYAVPSESPVNVQWLECPLSPCAFGLPNFCMTSFLRTVSSSSKEM